jgi:hypothetical protein
MNSDELKQKLGIHDDVTYRIDEATGFVQKDEGRWGWSNTTTRVDLVSGEVQKRGFLHWEGTGIRIERSDKEANNARVARTSNIWGWVFGAIGIPIMLVFIASLTTEKKSHMPSLWEGLAAIVGAYAFYALGSWIGSLVARRPRSRG